MSLRHAGKWVSLTIVSLLLYGVILEVQVHFWGRVLHPHEHVFLAQAGNYGDPLQFMWFLNWWSYALSHHITPLYSDFLWHPTTVHTLWVTSTPFLSVLTSPIQKAYGVAFTYNLLTILSPVLASTTAFMLCFYLTEEWFPSFLGGFFFGFSPYETSHLLLGDLNLSFIALIPLLLLFAIIDLRAKKIKTVFFGLLLGTLLAAEFLISTEVFAIFVFFSFISLALFYFTYRNMPLLLLLLKRITAGLFLSFLLLLPVIPSLFHGSVYGGGKNLNTFGVGNDLLSLIIPPSFPLISYELPLSWYKNEIGLGYLGIPVLIILLLYTRSQWMFPQGRFLTALMGLFLLLSLGATLHLFGICLSPFPWTFAEHLPLIGYASPVRFTLYFWLVFSMVVAFWMSKISRESQESITKFGLIILAILFLWPKPLSENQIPLHQVFTQGSICKILPTNRTLLYFPWEGGEIDYQQIEAHMCFKAAEGGYGGVPSPFNRWPLNYLFIRHRFKEMSPDIFHHYLANFDVGLVVISKNLKNRPDLEDLLNSSGFQRSQDSSDDPTVELYGPPKDFIYRKLTHTEQEEIFTYREEALRKEVIASNREKIKQVVTRIGFSSDQRVQEIYSWLLDHHILK